MALRFRVVGRACEDLAFYTGEGHQRNMKEGHSDLTGQVTRATDLTRSLKGHTNSYNIEHYFHNQYI